VRGTKKDYYEILGVPRNASKDQIDAAFAKLAMKWHPDRVPPEKKKEAEKKFKEISEAYAVLSDPEKRRLYDMGVDPDSGAAASGVEFSWQDIEEIFNRFFGGFRGFGDVFDNLFGGGKEVEKEDLDVILPLELSLEEIVRGAKRRIRYRRRETCHRCRGIGIIDPRTCSTCKGNGRVRRYERGLFGTFILSEPCPTCKGRGFEGRTCDVCRGRGYVIREVEREVEIPAGVVEGQKVIFKGLGHRGKRGVGRLILQVKEKPYPRYERKGRDLIYDMILTPAKAVLGGKVEFVDLRGQRVSVSVPEGVQHGEVFARIQGAGVPDPRGGKAGDLLVRARIRIPSNLPRKVKDLYKQILELESSI